MKTLKEWKDYKKKNAIPDGAVDGVSFGPALEKCQKVVDSDKGQPDKLKAVNDFWKVFKRYSTELDTKTKSKAKKFLDELREEMEEVEKVSFEEAAKRADGKGKVVNLDPGDKVIDPASQSIAEKRKMGADAGLR